MSSNASPPLIPLWIKLAYTAFMAVLIPVYLKNYGATNFLYFCDVAAVMTLIAIWIESPLLISACLVGIFLPQMLWVIDFFCELANWLGLPGPDKELHLTGLTTYMFQPPYFLRFLSFFHFWLPFLLIWLVKRIGYDKRAFLLWTVIAWGLVTVSYAWMPPSSPTKDANGNQLRDPNLPVNIDYVYGFSDEERQRVMDPDLYVGVYMAALVVIFLVTHLLFWAVMAPPRKPAQAPG